MCWVWRQGGKGGPELGYGLVLRRGCRTRAQRPDCQGLPAASEAHRPPSVSGPNPPLSPPGGRGSLPLGCWPTDPHSALGVRAGWGASAGGTALSKKLIFVKMVATGVIMTIKVIAKRLSRQAQAVRSSSKASPRLSASGLSGGNSRGHR